MSTLVDNARRVASMVARWPLPMHVEEDDICSFVLGRAVLARMRGGSPYLKGLAIEYLRSFAGDTRRHSDTDSSGPRNGKCTRFLHLQMLPGFDPAGETDFARELSLRRCGLLMLRSLPQRRLRQVIVLRYWHGLSGEEAARLMKISPSRLAQLQAEALGIIRDCLFERGISSIGDVM